MEKFHTVIIGAGPAGLACAAILARAGRPVLILERNSRVGPKVCAGGVPYHALKRLQLPEELIEHSFPEQQVITPWQRATVRAKEPIISTVNRETLGQWMQEKAIQAGAVLRTGTMVRQIHEQFVTTGEEKIGYRYLVGADGSGSMVRRHLGLPSKRIGAGIQYHVAGDFNHMEWHLDPQMFQSGYGWIFPHQGRASVGVYAERHDLEPKLLKERLHQWAARQGIDLSGCKPEAALINFDYQGWRFENLFLTGDAAGLASGFTGEGILPAVISGEAAARTILAPNHQSDEMTRLLTKHQRHSALQKFFTGNKVICHLALEMLVLALRNHMISFHHLEMG